MITKLENAILLCITGKNWKIEEQGKQGTSYTALIYTNKEVYMCKTDETLFKRFENQELLKGTAVIRIEKTNYNNVERVVYRLEQFGITK